MRVRTTSGKNPVAGKACPKAINAGKELLGSGGGLTPLFEGALELDQCSNAARLSFQHD